MKRPNDPVVYILKANVINVDLSPCGGAERLTLVTMCALSEKGIRFDLTTCIQPNAKKLENAYGTKLASIFKKTERINILHSLEDAAIDNIVQKGNYDITINTDGDTLPFYHYSFSKENAITYCHFPTAKYHIDSENLEYLRDIRITNISQIHDRDFSKRNAAANLDPETKHKAKNYFRFLRAKYESLMKNTLVLTNSQYCHNAIRSALNIDAKILYPPVDVDTFHDITMKSGQREDLILVISRIAPDKQIENAIELARIMRDRSIGKAMIIVGNLDHYDYDYCQSLKKMIAIYDLSNYVSLQINTSFSKLIQLMQLAKVYFHPRIDEHFGISTAEAMAAGLVPVVSYVGGHTEFVPSKYHFHTLHHAAELIALAFEVTDSERRFISKSTFKFSNKNYIQSFHSILSELFDKRSLVDIDVPNF
ncbi:MAG: glycosyltransferase [Thermoproteota archaeon]|nr:glycosyltransferase [Thermoproteota archaeon]